MKNKLTMGIIIVLLGMAFLLGAAREVQAVDEDGNFVIVIDPGHGGSDSGAVAGGLREDYVNFEIAYYLKQELDQYEGVYTYLTRYNTCPSIYDRVEFAKERKADLFISVHNDSGASSATGTASWVTQDNTQIEYYQKAAEVANQILYRISNLGLRNNGVKTRSGQANEWYDSGVVQDYYGVIRYAQRVKMRSLLVEHCYISNAYDRNFINTKEGIIKLAKADAQGIVEAYQLRLRGQGTTPVKSLAIDPIELNLEMTAEDPQPVAYLNALFNPSNASNQEADWYSTNPEIVRIYGNKIRGLREGEATIKAISRNNQRMATCKVIVTKPKVALKDLTVDKEMQIVEINQTGDILVNFNPENCDDKTLYWESSNPDVVRIWNGHFRGLKEGESIITATSRASGKKVSCKVMVKDPNKAYVEDVLTEQEEYTIQVDEAIDIKYSYIPNNSINAEFYWDSSNSEIIRVFGNRVRGLKLGTADLIIKTLDGTFEKRIKVTVKEAEKVKVQDVITDQEEYTIQVNEAVDVKYNYMPTNSTNAEFYWDSSNSNVLRVFGNRFRGLKPGTADLIIKTLDGTFEKRIKVTVKDAEKTMVKDVITDKEEYIIGMDEAINVSYTYEPSNSVNAEFYWDTSNPEVLRVFGNRFRGLKEGTAEVIIRTLDGTFEKRIKVIVKDKEKINVENLILDQEEYTIKVDEAMDISYDYEPSNATNAEFYWDSSNPEVLRVFGNRFRGLKEGTAEVVITTLDGKYEKRVKVIVTKE